MQKKKKKKKGCFQGVICTCFHVKKKGVKIAANVLETVRKRVYFLTWGMIKCYAFE